MARTILKISSKYFSFLTFFYYDLMICYKNLVEKWSTIFEEYINKDISEKITKVVEDTLSSCYNKNLYRTYQMKKILPDNESL